MVKPGGDELETILSQLGLVQLGVIFVAYAVIRGSVVRRTGHSFWWGFLWALPVIGWFFKVWLAHANWPGVKSCSAKKAPNRKRAAA